MSIELWTEKYRPKSLDDYVWKDANQRKMVEQWIAQGSLPHLMFSGAPGTGKTSLAKLLLRELKIPESDILEVNASRERKVDLITEKFQNFVGSWAMGDSGLKYVIFDECDSMTPLFQRSLRNDLESFSDVCRVIFTCNYPQKIIPALHDRCQKLQFAAIDRGDFQYRMVEILVAEGIAVDEKVVNIVKLYVDKSYPSLRKCINLLQENILDGVLQPPKTKDDDETGKDYLIDIVTMFQTKKFVEARKLLVAQARPEEYPDIFRYFYQNLDMFGTSIRQQEDALLLIRDAVYRHNIVADQEINLSALICELGRVATPNY
jgi:DNA polymerase III delta prime subunit